MTLSHRDNVNEILLAPVLGRCVVGSHEYLFEFHVFLLELCLVFFDKCLEADDVHCVVVLLPPVDGCGKYVVYIHRCYFDIVVRCLTNVDIVIPLLLLNFHCSSIPDDNEVITDSVTFDRTI